MVHFFGQTCLQKLLLFSCYRISAPRSIFGDQGTQISQPLRIQLSTLQTCKGFAETRYRVTCGKKLVVSLSWSFVKFIEGLGWTTKLLMVNLCKPPKSPQKKKKFGKTNFSKTPLETLIDLFEKHGWERILSYFQTRMAGVVKKPGGVKWRPGMVLVPALHRIWGWCDPWCSFWRHGFIHGPFDIPFNVPRQVFRATGLICIVHIYFSQARLTCGHTHLKQWWKPISKNALVCLHHVHFDVNTIFIFHLVWITFPETNSSSHLKMDGWNTLVFLFWGQFQPIFRACSPLVSGSRSVMRMVARGFPAWKHQPFWSRKLLKIHRYISVMFQDIVLNDLFNPFWLTLSSWIFQFLFS